MFTQLAKREPDVVKAAFYMTCVDPTWTGMVLYRSLVAREDLDAECPSHCSLQTPIYVSHTLFVSNH